MMNKPKTPQEIHESWQEASVFSGKNSESKPKYYCLDMFPYPSAQGLHVGHPEGYTATDIISRYKRMRGMNVLHPMGWDAFGLPAENFAIKTGVDPDTSTHKNIDNFRRQIQDLGFSYDWSREVDTSSPEYYRWTQWMFLQMYKHGLAYRKKAKVNWCNTCQTVLANEQVIDGCCERSKDPVVQKDLEQWFFKITDYAERLLSDLDTIDWPEPIKLMQRNWIGKSEGTLVDFAIQGNAAQRVTIFTTRVDTIFSAAFIVLAPEHPLVDEITTVEQRASVEQYKTDAAKKTDLQRTELAKEKSGVFSGSYAINPVNGKAVPVWIGDFVLATYGTGAIFGDAHDDRDFVMAKKYDIPLTVSVRPQADIQWKRVQAFEECYTDDGILVNSGEFDGMTSAEARTAMTAWLEEKGVGKKKVNYRLRDWLISRQRYWGAPIPVVYDPEGRPHPVKEGYLPVLLPTDVDYLPKGTSPLGSSEEYKKRAEELYGKGWHFEIDTMDTFVCSSWYYLRYCDPKNEKEFASKELLKKWLPVDLYVGGAEHAVLHLLYARFFHKALQDFDEIPQEVGSEPFKALRNQGMILGEDHQKMSKSRGNVINPDDIVKEYGADALRMYEMFMGPLEDVKPWDTSSIAGINRFLHRIEKLYARCVAIKDVPGSSRNIHKLVHCVTEDIEQFRFNTAISKMMVGFNERDFAPKINAAGTLEGDSVDTQAMRSFLILLSIFAPFTSEKLWNDMGYAGLVAEQQWPSFDVSLIQDETATVAVQINGKTRGTVILSKDASEQQALDAAHADEKIAKHIEGKTIAKAIYVPGRVLNVIIKG